MAKVAIVTGASRGIGRSIAERLAHDGFSVVVNYAGNQKEAGEVVKQIESKGGKALAIKANVGNKEDVDRLFQETLKAFGQVDVVVNNAGIMPLSLIAKEDAETFDKVIATNLRGTFLVFAQAAQHIAEGGRIIAFSSSVLAKSFPSYGPYIASKAGVEGLVPVLANELRGKNITVNAVCPSYVDTDIVKGTIANIRSKTGRSEAEALAALVATNPQRRLIEPREVADTVMWLCRPGSESVTGQSIVVAGGELM